jgi:hypothetical protein
LEASNNPFAKVVLAHLKVLETRDKPTDRRNWKFRVVRGLYERGFTKEDARRLFNVIDWLMVLPRYHQRIFRRQLDEYEEGRQMPYVNSIAREGMLHSLETALRTRFGAEGVKLIPAISELDDAEKYDALHQVIIQAESLDEVRRECAKVGAPVKRSRREGNGKRGSSKA